MCPVTAGRIDNFAGQRPQTARSAGDEAWRRGENACTARAALGLNADPRKKFFLDIMVICACKFF